MNNQNRSFVVQNNSVVSNQSVSHNNRQQESQRTLNNNNIFQSFGKESGELASAAFPHPQEASRRTDSDIPSLLNRVSREESETSGIQNNPDSNIQTQDSNAPIQISSLSHRNNNSWTYQQSNQYRSGSGMPLSEIEESENIHLDENGNPQKRTSYQESSNQDYDYQ